MEALSIHHHKCPLSLYTDHGKLTNPKHPALQNQCTCNLNAAQIAAAFVALLSRRGAVGSVVRDTGGAEGRHLAIQDLPQYPPQYPPQRLVDRVERLERNEGKVRVMCALSAILGAAAGAAAVTAAGECRAGGTVHSGSSATRSGTRSATASASSTVDSGSSAPRSARSSATEYVKGGELVYGSPQTVSKDAFYVSRGDVFRQINKNVGSAIWSADNKTYSRKNSDGLLLTLRINAERVSEKSMVKKGCGVGDGHEIGKINPDGTAVVLNG